MKHSTLLNPKLNSSESFADSNAAEKDSTFNMLDCSRQHENILEEASERKDEIRSLAYSNNLDLEEFDEVGSIPDQHHNLEGYRNMNSGISRQESESEINLN